MHPVTFSREAKKKNVKKALVLITKRLDFKEKNFATMMKNYRRKK